MDMLWGDHNDQQNIWKQNYDMPVQSQLLSIIILSILCIMKTTG